MENIKILLTIYELALSKHNLKFSVLYTFNTVTFTNNNIVQRAQ